MDFGRTDEVLYVGDREGSRGLAEATEDCLVRWAASAEEAVDLVDRVAGARAFDCVVAAVDDPAPLEAARGRWPDVPCLTVDEAGPDEGPGERVRRADLPERVAGVLAAGGDLGYPITADEPDRRESVAAYTGESVLGAPGFDRIAALARRLLEAQVGLVGLLDEEHLHVAGCDGDFPARLRREESVCTHNILDGGPTVVEDVAHDPRFQDNDSLASLGVRAYAGVPVEGREGRRIGTVCVVDTIPRPFAERDVERLELLAAEAADQFELRRRLAEEARTETAADPG